MANLKTETIGGVKIPMELRVCAVPGCERHFWAAIKSKQSICGISCLEYSTRKMWRRGERQPRVRRPGDKKRNKSHNKKRHLDTFKKASLDSWALRTALLKAASTTELTPASLHQAAQAL